VPVPAYLASLRVFSPLSTFPSGERRRWERYLAAGRALDRASLVEREHEAALGACVVPTLDVDEEHALVEIMDGEAYLCPARTQLRVWQTAGEFREGLAALLADVFVPPKLADEAEDQLAAWREVSPDLRSHVQTSAWTIPSAWLLLFDSTEAVRGDGQLRYVTTIDLARNRATGAVQALEEAGMQISVMVELADVIGWLAAFDDSSRVELDYGVLAPMFGTELDTEDSVALLGAGLEALKRGDLAAAGQSYDTFMERWQSLRMRSTAS